MNTYRWMPRNVYGQPVIEINGRLYDLVRVDDRAIELSYLSEEFEMVCYKVDRHITTRLPVSCTCPSMKPCKHVRALTAALKNLRYPLD